MGWGLEGWGLEGGAPNPENWGPKGWRAKNVALFSLSCHNVLSFFSLLRLNFGGVFEGLGPAMCTFGLSGCRVEPRRLPGPSLHELCLPTTEDGRVGEGGREGGDFGPSRTNLYEIFWPKSNKGTIGLSRARPVM